MQTTSHILMVRPAAFSFNTQTAASNAFQKEQSGDHLQNKAETEFDEAVTKLREAGITVTVVNDTPEPVKPDAVFPNNWITMHSDGTIVLYPMHAVNRRFERRKDIVELIQKKYRVSQVIDLSSFEQSEKYLEGTGSCIFDHDHRTVYACLSPRTHLDVLQKLCAEINYKPVYFTSLDGQGKQIYHTNVMMCISSHTAIICMESIRSEQEKEVLREHLHKSGKQLLEISLEQVNAFAGNMLALKNNAGHEILVMSASAYNSLSEAQVRTLENSSRLLTLNIPTIEFSGGGSARCMIAEIFLPQM